MTCFLQATRQEREFITNPIRTFEGGKTEGEEFTAKKIKKEGKEQGRLLKEKEKELANELKEKKLEEERKLEQ